MPAAIITSFLVEPCIATDVVRMETVPMSEASNDALPSAATALQQDVEEAGEGTHGGSLAGTDEVDPANSDGRLGIEEAHNLQSGAAVSRLRRETVSGLVEVTIGVYGTAGAMQAMQPSMQLKSGAFLSLQEKFETGRGVCLTPPPPEVVPAESLKVPFHLHLLPPARH